MDFRDEGKYVYIDVYVTDDSLKKGDGSPVLIKEGSPKNLFRESKLGKLRLRFGLPESDLDKSVQE